MAPPIFDGLSWGRMIAAGEDLAEGLETAARELREILELVRERWTVANTRGLVRAVSAHELAEAELAEAELDERTRPTHPLDETPYFNVGATVGVSPAECVDELRRVTDPIPGRPGYRVDPITSRVWYSSEWL